MNIDGLMPGVTPDDLAAWIAGAAAFVVVLLVWSAFVERDPLSGRLKSLEARRAALKGDLSRSVRRTERPAGRIGAMQTVVERFKLYGSSTAAKAAGRLAQAGYRSKDSLTAYLFAKAILPFAGLGVAALATFGAQALPLQGMQAAGVCVGAGLFGSLLPDLYLNRVTQKRQLAIRRALPDAYDLLVICAEAGLSLDSAFERVARELGGGCPELGEEIGLTSIELGFLPDRSKALQGLVERVPLPGIRALVTTLAQTERYGTPLAQALRVLASEMRTERMLKAEEKAARLPAIMTIPLMVFILPPLFIVLVGPAIIRSIDQFSRH